MTDDLGRLHRTRMGADGDSTVESLASRALSVLASKRVTAASLLSERFLDELREAAITIEIGRRKAVVHDMLEAGIRREDIADFYIPEAARRLGAAWCDDEVGFADVTIGVSRLQGLLREIGNDWYDDPALPADAPSLLLIVLADEFHTLGSMVLAGQLARMGISVKLITGKGESDVLGSVAAGHFDAIFVSVSQGKSLAALRKLVEKLRAASVRPTPVVIGGSLVNRVKDARAETGADHATTDPREALRLCGLRISAQNARRRATSE